MSKLKRLRMVRGLTQQEIGSRLGVSNVAVCLWERGETMPKPDTIPKLARMLGITPGALLEILAPSEPAAA